MPCTLKLPCKLEGLGYSLTGIDFFVYIYLIYMVGYAIMSPSPSFGLH